MKYHADVANAVKEAKNPTTEQIVAKICNVVNGINIFCLFLLFHFIFLLLQQIQTSK